MPPWYSLPEYIFWAIAFAGIILRDRWLITAAILLASDCTATDWVSDPLHADPHYAWALKALIDLSAATILAWPMRLCGVIMAALLGVNVTFYLIVGAAQASGSLYAQEFVNYHAWWFMEYLAFAACGVLLFIGFDNHGGKPIRLRIARTCRGNRRTILESHGTHRRAQDSAMAWEETITAMFAALAKLHRID